MSSDVSPYTSPVTLIELCPNRSATALICTPLSSHATAALCRSVCTPMSASPARFAALSMTRSSHGLPPAHWVAVVCVRRDRIDFEHRHRLCEALDRDLTARLADEAIAHEGVRVAADQHRPWGVLAFEPRRQVHRLSDRGVLEAILTAEAADGGIARMDAHARLQILLEELAFAPPLVEYAQPLLHGEGHLDAADGRLLRRRLDGGTEQHHDRVPDELVERSAVLERDVGHLGQVFVEHRRELVWIEALGRLREVLEVREEDGQGDAPLVLDRVAVAGEHPLDDLRRQIAIKVLAIGELMGAARPEQRDRVDVAKRAEGGQARREVHLVVSAPAERERAERPRILPQRSDELVCIEQRRTAALDDIVAWWPFMDELRRRDMPITIHSDLGNNAEPLKFLYLMEAVLTLYPDNKVVWAHMGLSKELTTIDPALHIGTFRRLMEQHPNLYLDISWRVLEDTYFSNQAVRDQYVPFFDDYSSRIITGTDFVAARKKDFSVYEEELDVTSRINKYLSDKAFRDIALGQSYFDLLGLPDQAPPMCAA